MRWRVRPLPLLLGVAGIISILLFFASSNARRIQAYFSVRSAKAVSFQELRSIVNGPMGRSASLFKGVFYVGSDEHFDYIAIDHGPPAIYAFKTQRGDAAIAHRMEITFDQKRWIDLAGAVSEARSGPADTQHKEELKLHVRNCDWTQYHALRISSDWVWRGGIVKRVEPTYPSEARRRRLQGRISVRVLINGDGEVEQACGNGPPILRDAAETAALQWTFRPPKLNGKKIPHIQERLVFDFVLDRSSDRESAPKRP